MDCCWGNIRIINIKGVENIVTKKALIVTIVLFVVVFLLFFLRNPERTPEGVGLVSPADGKVVGIETVNGFTSVHIFLSLFDVHVQRVPYNGTVESVIKEKDKVTTTIITDKGRIVVVQQTGFLVKRIQNYLQEGMVVEQNSELGRIILGSHTTITFPEGLTPQIVQGQQVYAGQTIIAS